MSVFSLYCWPSDVLCALIVGREGEKRSKVKAQEDH